MAEANSNEGTKRFRSPPYPAISLGKAIERAKELHNKALHHAVPIKVVADAWEYGVKSSGLWAAAAALLQFGLLSDEGSGDKRKFTLTESAVRIVRDPNPDSEKRRELIKQAALAPKVFQELWIKYGASIHTLSDIVLKSHLTVERQDQGLASYSDVSADEVIRVFKETIAYAGLSDSDTISPIEADKGGVAGLAHVSHEPGSEGEFMQTQVDQPRPATRLGSIDVTPLRVTMNGNRLDIQASVDLAGLKKLQEMLTKYQGILEMMQPDEVPPMGNMEKDAQGVWKPKGQ